MKLVKPAGDGDGPSEAINGTFHSLYDATRDRAAQDAPVLVVSVDALTLCRGKVERTFPIAHGEFHAIKAAAHAPVAVFAALRECEGQALTEAARQGLRALGRAARSRLSQLGGRTDAIANDVRDILRRSLAFVDRVLDGAPNGETLSLEAFARECGAGLGRLTTHGTRAQLTSLDATADAALETLSPEERSALQVVVTGEHQARARSLAMQYFQKRFGEKAGAELRVAYGEGVTSTAEARALVATRKLDRAIAAAFFGDARRLQQDVLGDAAEALLAEDQAPEQATTPAVPPEDPDRP